MARIHLERATTKDIPTLITIEKKVADLKTYSALTTAKEWEDELKASTVYLIFKDKTAVGDISYEKKSDSSVYLSGFVVDPKLQGQGIGREALIIIMEELKNEKIIKLVTHPENSGAIRLYLSFGFVIKSWRDNYFGDGEPRVEMVKE